MVKISSTFGFILSALGVCKAKTIAIGAAANTAVTPGRNEFNPLALNTIYRRNVDFIKASKRFKIMGEII